MVKYFHLCTKPFFELLIIGSLHNHISKMYILLMDSEDLPFSFKKKKDRDFNRKIQRRTGLEYLIICQLDSSYQFHRIVELTGTTKVI